MEWEDGSPVTDGNPVNNKTTAVRPAFNLELNSVLFTSAAANGKSIGTVGRLPAVSDYAGNEWKLTLLDAGRSAFAANVNGQTSVSVSAGGSVQITYSDAQTGANEYVSVLLCDSNGNVLYYGNIAQNSTNGTATLNIPVRTYCRELYFESVFRAVQRRLQNRLCQRISGYFAERLVKGNSAAGSLYRNGR